jgi:hypothetical protein
LFHVAPFAIALGETGGRSIRRAGKGLSFYCYGSDYAPSREEAMKRTARCKHFERLESRFVLTGPAVLVISEFMARNDSTIEDEDGENSDWIEIYNADTVAVNLDDWYLTDNAGTITKWPFPNRVIDPGEYLLVWASGKNRRNPAAALHTNFALAAGGEYLALVYDDPVGGPQVVGEFAPTFPPQQSDISYGYDQPVFPTALVGESSIASLLVPTVQNGGDDLGSAWTLPNFDDSGWTSDGNGVGYDTEGELSGLIDLNAQAAMQNTNSTVFTRYEFAGVDPTSVDDFDFNVNYDDGFVAYLNGTEIARRNAPAGTPAWDAAASDEHGGILADFSYANFADTSGFTCLSAAAEVGGACKVSGNRLRITHAATGLAGAAWTSQPVQFGPDFTFSARMDIDIHSPGGAADVDGVGADGMVFVLHADGNNRIGACCGALGLEGGFNDFVGVEFDTWEHGSFDPFGGLGTHIGIDVSGVGSIARVAVPRFNGGALGANIRHVWIDYDGATNQMGVYFTDQSTKPATPTLTATVDFEAIFGDTPFLYAGWTAGTGGAYNAHDVLNWDIITDARDSLALEPETIDLSQHIGLLSPTGNVLAIHGLNISAADGDFLIRPELVSTVISPIDTDQPRWFIRPTPGGANGTGSDQPTAPVTLSRSSGTFVDPFSLELSTSEPGAEIYYTLNGAAPTTASTRYTAPITVQNTTHIRAIAAAPGQAASPIVSGHFIALDGTVADFESPLPIVILDSHNASIPGTTSTTMATISAVLIDTDITGRARSLGDADYAGRAGLRVRGRTASGMAKTPYSLELRDEGDTDKDLPLLGMPAEADWHLINPHSQKTMLQDPLVFQWSNEIAQYASRSRFVEVFRNTDGDGKINYGEDYVGVYLLMEKIKIGNDRVDVSRLGPKDNAAPDVTGGYIFKKDKFEESGDVWFNVNGGTSGPGRAGPALIPQQTLQIHDPDASEATSAQINYLQGYLNEFVAALNGPEFMDPVNGYRKYVDVESWIDHWILNEMSKNIDGFRLSQYWHKDRDVVDPVTGEVLVAGKIKMGPVWDFDLSLGNSNFLRGGHPNGWYKDQLSNTDYPYWNRMFQDPYFKQKLTDRWRELRSTVFATEELLADIDSYVDLLSDGNPLYESPVPGQPTNPISRNNTEYANHLATYHWPNCYYPGNMGDCPTTSPGVGLYPHPMTYQDHLTILKDFIMQRTAWMDTQFLGSPEFSHDGGEVETGFQLTMTSPVMQMFTETTLVDVGAGATAIVPDAALNTAIGTTWRNRVFDDSTWIHGTTGVGYERGTGYEGDLGINLLTVEPPSMRIDPEGDGTNNNNTAYVRIPFNFSGNPADIDALFLRVRYDDSYVAYLNGTEIGRANFTGTPAWNSPATAPPTHEAGSFEEINITTFKNQLLTGNNVLAIHAMNDQATSTDMLILPMLVARYDGVGSNAPMYYTTDGTDPLTPSGGINLTAQLYTGPITINDNVRVLARTYKPGNTITPMATNWSAPTDALFITEPTPLVVTEMNFNPAPPTPTEQAAGVVDNEEFEFLELKNVGSDPLDLTGVRFTDGIEFTFGATILPAGAHVVVVKNLNAFALRYGPGLRNIAGEYDGNLANEGERIALVTGLGESPMDFTYDDWYDLADGEGYALTIVNSLGDGETWSLRDSWRPSDYALGTPDGDDVGLAPPQVSLAINEIVANATVSGDRIEIANSASVPISIDGFYLSDDPFNPTKYRLPASTPGVPPGGYLVLDEEAYFGGAFDLSQAGGTLVLHAADVAGNLIGFRASQEFGAALPDTSHGRYVKSDGTSDFVELTAATLGAANAAPRVGPVVINEILYRPAAGKDEFIELVNISAATVSLADWALAGAVDYGFSGVTLAAGEHLVVSSIDPAAFRAKYAIPAAVQVVGPYDGVLDDSDPNGENVELYQPGGGSAGVIVDRVRYFSSAPWPAIANRPGLSLIRLQPTAYGNDAVNWGAGSSGGTPGAPNLYFDPTPPTDPGPPVVTVLEGPRVALSWQPATDPESGVARYRVMRNNVEIGTSTTTSFVDTTAALNTAYHYFVVAENPSDVSSFGGGVTPLKIFSISSVTKTSPNQLRVTFPEAVTEDSAENLANYHVSQTTLISAVLEADARSVLLGTAAPIVEGTGYRVVANNLVSTDASSVLVPNANVTIIPGVANALLGEYYDDAAGSFATPPESAVLGTKIAERVDPEIRFTWLAQPYPYTDGGPPFTPNPTLPTSAQNTIGVRWSGRLLAPTTGLYTFTFMISANDGVRFWIDADDDRQFEDIPSERIVNAWPSTMAQTGTINLVANQVYNIRLDFYENNSTAHIWMHWQHPGQATAIIVPSSNLFTPTPTETERPNVTAIKLGSSSWTPAFKSQLHAAGFGTGGINVPLGGTTPRLPWSNLNQVSMTFSEDVNVGPTSLLVNGVNAASYGVASVNYDYATYTATWTLANPLPNDRATLSLANSAADLVGNVVEGTTGATLLALPGDVNQSGVVDQADFRASLDAQFRGIGSPGYSVLLDTDGNGAINIQDWQNVQTAIGDTLPAPSPAWVPGAVVVQSGTSQAAVNRANVAAALRATASSRLSRLAIDQIVSTPSDNPANSVRTLRASRAPRVADEVNAAALDAMFTVR